MPGKHLAPEYVYVSSIQHICIHFFYLINMGVKTKPPLHAFVSITAKFVFESLVFCNAQQGIRYSSMISRVHKKACLSILHDRWDFTDS